MQVNKNKKKSRVASFAIIATVLSIFFINYLQYLGAESSTLLILVITTQLLLYALNPLCSFVFCFVTNINIMNYPVYTWLRPVTVLLSFLVFILNPKLLLPLFENRKLINIFYCSLLFSFFVLLISLISKTDVNFNVIAIYFNILFGFLIFLPAYYFTIVQPKNLFICLTAVASCFLIVYYANLIFVLNLFKIGDVNASIESDLTRLAGYDIRQFIIFYFFLIPAFLLTKAVTPFYKYCIVGIGLLAFLVLVLGIYRLAMFYNFMGLLLSIFFIGKYVKTGQLFKRFIFIAIFLGFAMFFFSEYIIQFQKVYEGTFDYFSGKGEDKSADERFLNQTPILLAYIYNDFWTGCGLVKATLMTNKEMFGFVDIPIMGSLAKFGFAGVFIYYMRFYFLLREKTKLTVSFFAYYNEQYKLLFYVYITIKAYIISLITFRLFYISWELAFDWQQIEFGLIIGIHLGLERIISQNEGNIYRKLKTAKGLVKI